MILRHRSPDAGCGIDLRMPPQNRSRIQHRVAAHLGMVTDKGTALPQSGGDPALTVLYRHISLIRPDIGGHASGTHVGATAQDAVTHIVKMAHLHMIKEIMTLRKNLD